MNETVKRYERIVMNIGELIEVSGYRNDYLAGKLGLTTVNFSAKKKRKTFTLEEIRKLAYIIDNDDVQDYLMVAEMEERENEETITHEELFRRMGWK
ncbi:hypothetical protein GCM10007423_53340 [Dyadobacter endophyticus]|uniref:Uncharacterized protein n=2 Tax=Dyadobacter endophyticus TaxID=1749036 RepID=A0ABQ1Z849_9BACT|nr:hypothetical protein GCM10007423_53340 [Dyadobacter endophyticus]